MIRQQVKSSNIRSIGYDPATCTLEIESCSGSIYQYEDFSPDDWTWFRQQESIGSHFAREIRNKFKSKKMEPEPDAEKPKTDEKPPTANATGK